MVRAGHVTGFLFPEVGEEIHLQRIRQLRRGSEREVDVAGEDLGDVRTRDVHAPGKLGLVDAQLLHPKEDLAKKRGTNMIDGGHRG